MEKDNLNPNLMIGDEVTVVHVDKSYGTMNTPERFKDYVVTGIKHRQPENWEGPDADRKYYTIEPLSGYSDEEATGRMLAGGGRRREERLYTNDDSWILRPGFRRGELNEHNQPGINPDLEVGDIIRVIDIDGEHANMPDRFGMYKVYSVMGLGGSQEPYYQLSGETSEVVEDSTRTTRMFKPRSTPTLTNAKYLYRGDTWIYANVPMANKVDRKTISEQKKSDLNPELKIGDEIIVLDVGVDVKNDMNKPDKYVRYFVTNIYGNKELDIPLEDVPNHLFDTPEGPHYYGLNRPDVDVTDPDNPGVFDRSSTHKHLYPRTDTWMFNPKGPTMRYEDAFQPEVYMSDEEYEELYGDDGMDEEGGYLEEQVNPEDYGIIDGEKRDAEAAKSNTPDAPDRTPFTKLEVAILKQLHKNLDRSGLQTVVDETPGDYGSGKKFWDVMKLFGINYMRDVVEDTRTTKYAKWALDNWTEDGDYGSIERPIKEKLKWFDVDREESGTQVEYKDGSAEVLGFDGDDAGTRADYDFYAWGGEMETNDYGDYEQYDSEITRSDFIRVDEGLTPKMVEELKGPKEIQDLLFNFWKNHGPTLDPDRLKLIGFNMNDADDRTKVTFNLVEYYGDEELINIITDRLEGIQGWEYEYVVTSIDFHDLLNFKSYPFTIMVDVIVDGSTEVPVTTEDGIEDITLWEANERAQKEWKGGGPGPYDNMYEEVREQVLSDVSILLKNLPVEPMLDYVDFSEPNESIDNYVGTPEIMTESKIDDLVWSEKPTQKQIKKMNKSLGNFEGFPIEKFKNIPPPENESTETEEEIDYLNSIPVEDKFVKSGDELYEKFESFLKSKDLEYPEEEIEKAIEGLGPIIMKLKYHYNRPRPYQVAQAKNLKLDSEHLDSANTPSYPSGHATRGIFLGRYLADLYPEYEKELRQIGEDIAFSRNMAKVHYPSDSEFGKMLGNDLYEFAYQPEEELSEQVTVTQGDMLKSDIFKFLSNRFALTPTDFSEIKDMEGNYYRLIDIEEPHKDVNLSELLDPVVEMVSYGMESGVFKEGDVQKGIEAITDWISLSMNQEKDLMN